MRQDESKESKDGGVGRHGVSLGVIFRHSSVTEIDGFVDGLVAAMARVKAPGQTRGKGRRRAEGDSVQPTRPSASARPSRRTRLTLNRSPHGNKTARDQFYRVNHGQKLNRINLTWLGSESSVGEGFDAVLTGVETRLAEVESRVPGGQVQREIAGGISGEGWREAVETDDASASPTRPGLGYQVMDSVASRSGDEVVWSR
jgi:hypothetical protein